MPSGSTLGLVKVDVICLVFVNVVTFTGLSVTDLLLSCDLWIMMCGHRCRGVHLYICVEEVPRPIGIVVKTT